ncbi:MAG: exodeoxyribonuclease VII small subunit [Ignavibacteriaceae bacterium]|jgi:exodeoxyribonuclease VII small subunit|nr:exodeoxyribonuclease VII small subunit [Ignavibacteriaceae bacterium]
MAKKKIKSNFEQDLSRLEEISRILEEDNVELEKAISLFEEGVKLSKTCLKTLKEAELKITELKGELGKLTQIEEE